MGKNKDVFICHASKDKQKIVYPLIEAIEKENVSYWLYDIETGWGDGSAESINRGLKSSNFVIAVLSDNFIRAGWGHAELFAIRNEEITTGRTKLLPIMIGSKPDAERILKSFPLMRDKHYLNWNDGVELIVKKLKQKLRNSNIAEEVAEEIIAIRKKAAVNDVELIQEVQDNGSMHKCEEWISTIDQSILIKIPSGKFWRGSELGDGSGDEMPITQVYLDEFYIDKYPVTNRQFAHFVEIYEETRGNPFVTTAEKNGGVWECNGKEWIRVAKTWRDYYSPTSIDHPVVAVSVEDAKEYCNWSGKRLPTEAQWERAARGDDASVYPWGEASPRRKKYARYLESSRKLAGTVNVYADDFKSGQSPFGCFHMSGNVWEWCDDFYDNYPRTANMLNNPAGPNKGKVNLDSDQPLYVNRGGSWIDNWCALRCASRSGDISDAYYHVGFRCVMKQIRENLVRK